jgi:non-ribosomal peptide synthetase component E (peptide arylation enzyme)
VVPRYGEKISLEEIVTFLSDIGVALYKVPERMILMSKLPRNPLNKVLRNELSAVFENEKSSQAG